MRGGVDIEDMSNLFHTTNPLSGYAYLSFKGDHNLFFWDNSINLFFIINDSRKTGFKAFCHQENNHSFESCHSVNDNAGDQVE